MRAAAAPQKLRFTVQACSGEDPEYPARELLYHSPSTRGWQSPRFCKYPHELLLRLDRPAKVQQIQILAHEFKIPSKIEVYIGTSRATLPDPGSAAPKKLGHLSFDSNEATEYQARELKSVHVSVEAAYVRLVLHRCHVNKLNIYNQVGLIAINLIGEPVAPAGGPLSDQYLDTSPVTNHDVPYYNRSAAADMADLNLDIHVDSVTAARIRELARAKEAAVASEDYDEAKRLKYSLECLKMVGQKIAQLEARKRVAVEQEDYDLAKALKVDIEKLRVAGESAAVGDSATAAAASSNGHGVALGSSLGAGGLPRNVDPGEVFDRVLARNRTLSQGLDGEGLEGGTAAAGEASGGLDYGGEEPGLGPGSNAAAAAGGGFQRAGSLGSGGRASAAAAAAGFGSSPRGGALRQTYQAYEERPAVAKGVGAAALAGGAELEGLIRADPVPSGGGGGPRVSRGAGGAGGMPGAQAVTAPPPQGWSRDLPAPEALPAAAVKDAEPVVEVAGEYVAAAFFSRTWQLRDAATGWVTDLVRNGKVSGQDARETAKGLGRLAIRGMKDKVAGVFNASLPLFQAVVAALCSSGAGAREVGGLVEQAIPVLVEKLGDNNARLRDSSRDALLSLARQKDSGFKGHCGLLVKPPKTQTAWRPVLNTLQLLQELVPLLGLVGGPGGGGFEPGEVMEYLGKAFGSANAEVRAAAVKVAAVACMQGGPAVRKRLPKDMNPKIKEQLDAVLGPEAPGALPTPAPAQPSPAPSKTPSHVKPAKAASSSAMHSQQQQNSSSRQQPQQRGGGGGGHGAAGGQHHGSPGGGAAAAAAAAGGIPGDPAPFLAELKAQEQRHGPNHPSVAEACNNLAMLYNQKGDYSAARPLYERALQVYEGAYGSNHQEVAHTLTDLAVLHLEQGNDAQGRPLLERALAIQTGLLGPDHPDVQAIRDVLNSE